VWDFEGKALLYRLKLHKVLIESLTFSKNELYLSSLGGVEDKVAYHLIFSEYDYSMGSSDREILVRLTIGLAQNCAHIEIFQEFRREVDSGSHRRDSDNID
jgi:hypothetical protein